MTEPAPTAELLQLDVNRLFSGDYRALDPENQWMLDIRRERDELRAACTGGETVPELWRLAALDALLTTLTDECWPDRQPDRAAAWEAVYACHRLHDDLAAALRPLAEQQELALREEYGPVETTEEDVPL